MHDRDVDHAYVSTHCMTTKEAYNYMLEGIQVWNLVYLCFGNCPLMVIAIL